MAGRVYDDNPRHDTVWDIDREESRSASRRELEPNLVADLDGSSPWDHVSTGGFEGDDFARAMWGQT